MHKRRAKAPQREVVATCIIWGLIVVVLIQLSSVRNSTATYVPEPFQVPAAAAAAAVAATQPPAEHDASLLSTSSPSQEASVGSRYVLSPSKQLRLGPESYAGSPLVVITSTTAPYIEWTLNWSAHLKRLGVNHAVVALDPHTVNALAGPDGIPAVLDASEEAQRLGLMTHQTVRREYAHLRTLGYLRVGLPFHLMQQYRWQAMLLSDADVIWLRHPSELLQVYPDAELMVSTDCLSAKAVVQREPEVYRCGMQPGGWNSAWNTGVVVVRDTPTAVAAMSAWRDAMAPSAPRKSVEGWWVDDQLALTQLLDSESMPFRGPDPVATSLNVSTNSSNSSSSSSQANFKSPTILAMKRQLKVVALSPLDISGGNVAFHQRLPEAYNITPFAVHYTFQTKFDNAGKLSRARETNFWLRDPPEPPGSRYLTYSNAVEAWLAGVDRVWQQHTGRHLAEMHKHVLAAAFQLQVFVEALAAAQAVNRTLAPPRLVCYCTQDPVAWADSLHTCAIAGSDKLPPFECTMENLINVVEQQRSYGHMLRTPDFLTRPELQQLVGSSRTGVAWVRSVQGSSQGLASEPYAVQQLLAVMQATGPVNLRPQLPLRVIEPQLRGLLGAHAATAVVDLGLLAPGWFAGLEDPTLAGEVRQAVADMTMYVGWCCLLEAEEGQDMQHAYVNYQQPVVPVAGRAVEAVAAQPAGSASVSLDKAVVGVAGESASAGTGASSQGQQLATASQAWQPAAELFQRPSWCGGDYLRPFNFNVSMRPQHPCRYLDGVVFSAGLQHDIHGVLEQVHELRFSKSVAAG